jgi:hypothetical protein
MSLRWEFISLDEYDCDQGGEDVALYDSINELWRSGTREDENHGVEG